MGATTPVFSFEVTTRELEGLPDARGDSVKSMLASNYNINVESVSDSRLSSMSEFIFDEAERTVYDLFADPVMEEGSANTRLLDNSRVFSEAPSNCNSSRKIQTRSYRHAGQAGLDGLLTLFPHLATNAAVATTRTYAFWESEGKVCRMASE